MHQVKRAFLRVEIEYKGGGYLAKDFNNVQDLASFLKANPAVAAHVNYTKQKTNESKGTSR